MWNIYCVIMEVIYVKILLPLNDTTHTCEKEHLVSISSYKRIVLIGIATTKEL